MQEWEEKIYIREEGRQEGTRLGIQALILDNLEEKKSEEQIIQKLMKRFSLSEDEARRYFVKYRCEE